MRPYSQVATRSDAYHLALTVASALAPLTVEPERQQDFVNTFLARWGEAAFEMRRTEPETAYVRAELNEPWVAHFPDSSSRPARHTQLGTGRAAQCDFVAYVDD